jgi:hypothetical protein
MEEAVQGLPWVQRFRIELTEILDNTLGDVKRVGVTIYHMN